LVLVGGLIIADRIWPSEQNIPRSITAETDAPQSAQNEIIEKSIAVLPFSDLSVNRDQDYFSDGITEEILTALSNIDDLRVAGRTSSFIFKDKNERNLSEIAQTLNVAHILEGSVRKQGDQVRITATLIGPQGFEIFSERYTGSLEDIFDLQEDVARAIADELKIFMDTRSTNRLADTLTKNTESYDLFLRGRELHRTSIKQSDIMQTLDYLEKAVELDQEFAGAWALLGQAALQAPANVSALDKDIYIAKADAASRKAIELDPTLPFPYAVRGYIRSIENDQLGAMELFQKALKIDPENSYALVNTGLVFTQMGLAHEGEKYFAEAVEMEPNRPNYKGYLAIAKRNLGKLDQSNHWAQEAVKSGYFISYDTLAWNAYSSGDQNEAAELMLKMHSEGGEQLSPAFQARSLWESGGRAYFKDSEEDLKTMRGLFKVYLKSPEAPVDGVIAAVLGRLGMFEEFYKYVGHSRGNAIALMGIWDDGPNTTGLRNHPDFRQFATSAGMVDFWNEYGWPNECKPSDDGFACI